MTTEHKPHSVLVDAIKLGIESYRRPGVGRDIDVYAHALLSLERLEEQLEAVTRDRDRLQHFIDCADTPLMRDVLAERDGLKEQLEAAISLEGWEDMRQYNIRLEERARELQEQLEAQREVLGWITSECDRMEEHHTGFKWIGRRIHGLWVDFPDASFPAGVPE